MVMRLLVLVLGLIPVLAAAQTRAVDPADLTLTITLEELPETPFVQEMVLLTIHGVYQRHITREKLVQPDLDGFNWMQMGQDHWYESQLNGKTVKNMRRRMALFPQRDGTLEIGAFVHRLTLLDENNNWFEYDIASEPITLAVRPVPQADGWWFPVRGLEVADNWSNTPDQLAPGEGVLRVVRISALGVGPEAIPPMPELRSPSAMIFAHPEKRLVDLTPRGPRSIAFWRWTITPGNGTSAILEPVGFSYFDTVTRQMRDVVISPQRVAFLPGEIPQAEARAAPLAQTRLHRGPVLTALLGGLIGALALLAGRNRVLSLDGMRDRLRVWRLRHGLAGAARCGDLAAMRRAARALDRAAHPDAQRRALLDRLDSAIYGNGAARFDARGFAARFFRLLPGKPGRQT